MRSFPRPHAALLALALLLAACGTPPPSAPPDPPPPPIPSSTEAPPPPEPDRAVLIAAGDNLIHDAIYLQAQRRAADGGYDFAPPYQRIAPIVAEADFAFINQETILAGDELPLSSYPAFCSPTQLGKHLMSLGFNLFATANNHSLDMGVRGIQAAGTFWDQQQDVAVAGCYRSPEERDAIPLLTRNNITVALIAATEHTNGIPQPADENFGVPLIGENLDQILEKLNRASQMADLVVLSLHWGIEGSDTPTDAQRELAQQLAEAGADIILGHHSHVLQSGEFIETSRGSCYVIYSLGNFISAQRGANNMAAGILRLELEKDPGADRAHITGASFIPTVTHYGPGYEEICIYPLSQYTPELAAAHGVRQYFPGFGMDYLEKEFAARSYDGRVETAEFQQMTASAIAA